MMQDIVVAKIAVDKTQFGFDSLFDYVIPQEFISLVQRGIRVILPFGNSNQKRQGMIFEVTLKSQLEINEAFNGKKVRLKPIYAVVDEQPVLCEEDFNIVNFMVANTFCSYYDAIKTVLPITMNIDISKKFTFHKDVAEKKFESFSDPQKKIVNFLKVCKNSKEISDILDYSSSPKKKEYVNCLIDQGVITVVDTYKKRLSAKTEKVVEIADNIQFDGIKLTKLQKQAFEVVSQLKQAPLKQVVYLSGASTAIFKTLNKKGFVNIIEKEVEAVKSLMSPDISINDIKLTDKQQIAFEQISKLLINDEASASLLHGVTGSGKTQVYIKLIDLVLSQQKQAIMLVPEIALTPQTVGKFKSIFGDRVAVLHSGLTIRERLEQYNKIKLGLADIVIGTRSAIFAPLRNIGIIIIDEEGEGSYKSDVAPRYHARDIAKLRCVYNKAVLVLGSATPCVDSYYNALNNKYKLVNLDERFAKSNLPNVYLVDMREERETTSCISSVLSEQIKINLDKKEQTILFVNRRGFNTYATCMECGNVITCPHCDVAMTYHKANGFLMCHYCGHTHKYDSECNKCNSKYIKLTGVGTQKLEYDLQMLYPNSRILRMDTDTIASVRDYDRMFSDFKNQEYDILIGTQMIAKGLDFENVTLVGVISADNGLCSENYNSGEKIFSLITQVVGRSGRSQKVGRAYLQTYNPENSIIINASNQDYKAFYDNEITYRKAALNPPFCDICIIAFSGLRDSSVRRCANATVAMLKKLVEKDNSIPLRVLGPSPCSVHKLNNKYRYKIIIKCKFNNKFKTMLSTLLREINKSEYINGISIYADINGDVNS